MDLVDPQELSTIVFEQGNSLRRQTGPRTYHNPWANTLTLLYSLQHAHVLVDLQLGVRINDDRSWLQSTRLNATKSSRSKKTAIKTRVIRDGCFDADENCIMTTTEIVRHSFGLRTGDGCLHTGQQSYAAIETGCPGQRDMRSLLMGYLCMVWKVRCQERAGLFGEVECSLR